MYKIVLFYKYVLIENPEEEMIQQRSLAKKLGFKGRAIVAREGINATYEGTSRNIQKYIEIMSEDPRFSDIHWKVSEGSGNAFPKLSVKVRPEIVSLGLGEQDINPNEITGKYLTPEELYNWIHKEKKEFYIIDMRNDYEVKSGYFENSIFPGFTNFRDLKESLPKIEHLKNKTIVTVCTGGVRCEKASGFLLTQGFSDVYQLQGGIVSYMEKYPNQDFLGKLYVFDNRLTMGFHIDSSEHTIVGKCEACGISTDHYVNCIDNFCHRHFIECEGCFEKYNGKCPPNLGCRQLRPNSRHTNQVA